MPKATTSGRPLQKTALASFTLVELLTVMAIMAILAALVLSAASGVRARAARARAASEIQGLSAALDAYKTDNGIYPPTLAATLATNSAANLYSFSTLDPKSVSTYIANSQILYRALASKVQASDSTLSTTSPATGKSYMDFKQGMIGDPTGVVTGTGSYVQDPWGYSYGYNATNAITGSVDIWSTGGTLVANANTNVWVANWK